MKTTGFAKTAGFTKKLFALAVVAMILGGCNTVQGIGKDVKKAGEVVENAAKK